MSHDPTLEQIDLTEHEFDPQCENLWHGERVKSSEPASWVVLARKVHCCGYEKELFFCQPCLTATRSAPFGYWNCAKCDTVWEGTPADDLIAQMRIRG